MSSQSLSLIETLKFPRLVNFISVKPVCSFFLLLKDPSNFIYCCCGILRQLTIVRTNIQGCCFSSARWCENYQCCYKWARPAEIIDSVK